MAFGLDKALRRQLGADVVDMDTEAGYARYGVNTPRELDVSQMDEAAFGAGYSVTSIELRVTGTVAVGHRKMHDKDIPQLRVRGSDQLLSLDESALDLPRDQELTLDLSFTFALPDAGHPVWTVNASERATPRQRARAGDVSNSSSG
ncbi:MAG: hypothetical protein P8N09_07565 [Planctomycetota bacterium]|nr:hypothetical protein [Planctomycetota bacterium]